MKKIFTILLMALLSVLSTVAQDAKAEKFKVRYSVGASAFWGVYIDWSLGGPKNLPGFGGYGSFEAQLSKHSGVEFSIGSSIARSRIEDYLVTSLSYKFYSRSVNLNAGIAYYLDLEGDYYVNNGIAPFVRISKDITIYKSLYCEPFFDVSVPIIVYSSVAATLGVALKYRF